MLSQLQNLDPKKSAPQEAIIPKISKSNADMLCFHLTDRLNGFIEASSYPNSMKSADMTVILLIYKCKDGAIHGILGQIK